MPESEFFGWEPAQNLVFAQSVTEILETLSLFLFSCGLSTADCQLV
jgi:hypothetical protein